MAISPRLAMNRGTRHRRESYGTGLAALGPERRIPGDPTFGEDADRLSGLQSRRGESQRLSGRRTASLDRDEAEPAQQRADNRGGEDAGGAEQAQTPSEPSAREREKDAVGEGGVVGHHDHLALGQRGKLHPSDHADA
jgi:hypothetical protein